MAKRLSETAPEVSPEGSSDALIASARSLASPWKGEI